MDLRKEVFSHSEKLWVLCLGQESLRKPLSPLIDMVDWYNNQLLTKSLLNNQIKVNFSALTLLSTAGQLPVNRLMVFGLGEEKSLNESHGKTLLSELSKCLEGLNEKTPWIIISTHVPQSFISEIKKGHVRLPQLAHSSISVE